VHQLAGAFFDWVFDKQRKSGVEPPHSKKRGGQAARLYFCFSDEPEPAGIAVVA
jgi:hypothetical protein